MSFSNEWGFYWALQTALWLLYHNPTHFLMLFSMALFKS